MQATALGQLALDSGLTKRCSGLAIKSVGAAEMTPVLGTGPEGPDTSGRMVGACRVVETVASDFRAFRLYWKAKARNQAIQWTRGQRLE